jgi:hypothetical protein
MKGVSFATIEVNFVNKTISVEKITNAGLKKSIYDITDAKVQRLVKMFNHFGTFKKSKFVSIGTATGWAILKNY